MLRRRIAGAVTLAAVLVAPGVADAAKKKRKAQKNVTVMTRNLYLGGDITRALGATAGTSGGIDTLNAFGTANYQTWQTVQGTDFPSRAALLAGEIKRVKPDLVGLQEVAKWRTGPMELNALGVSNASTVVYDFEKSLMAELKKAKAPYTVVRRQQESDVEGPTFKSTFDDGTGMDVRLTMHDLVLKRKTARLTVRRKGSAQYKARIPVPIGPVTLEFIRGYVWADVKMKGKGGKSFRFINTHLESETNGAAETQAKELLAGPAKKGRVILVGDFNSDPKDSTTGGASDPVANNAAYNAILGGGFKDAWPNEPFTYGFSETVNDDDVDYEFNQTIDHIFSKGTKKVTRKRSFGASGPRTATGLWPSDHTGTAVTIGL